MAVIRLSRPSMNVRTAICRYRSISLPKTIKLKRSVSLTSFSLYRRGSECCLSIVYPIRKIISWHDPEQAHLLGSIG